MLLVVVVFRECKVVQRFMGVIHPQPGLQQLPPTLSWDLCRSSCANFGGGWGTRKGTRDRMLLLNDCKRIRAYNFTIRPKNPLLGGYDDDDDDDD